MSNKIKIINELKEKIHELKEYLYSDICKSCGDAAIELDKISQRLSELEAEQNS